MRAWAQSGSWDFGAVFIGLESRFCNPAASANGLLHAPAAFRSQESLPVTAFEFLRAHPARCLGLLSLSIGHVCALAQTPPAVALTLDPAKLMQGFPPPPAYRVDALNWQQYPQKIWSFQHTRELFPTRRLQAQGPVRALRGDVASLERLQVVDGKTPLSWPEFLARNHIDAALVLHRGRIIDERYLNGMRPQTPHLMFSATKSMVGLMAVTAVAEGRLDPAATVGQVLPELADSAWGPATVRQVLDMTDGARFSEDYPDPSSDIYAYAAAMGWTPPEMRNAKQVGIQAMLPTVKATEVEPRGTVFRYRSPATDVACWLAARSTGRSLTQWLQERLWSQLGMEHDGNVMLDPSGTEVCFAGMSASLRDLGRIGQMLLDGGRQGDRQILPASVPAELLRGGDQAAFSRGIPGAKDSSYRSQWWVGHGALRSFSAIGAFGQRISVFPDQGVVMVLLSSHPVSEPPEAPLQAAVAAILRHVAHVPTKQGAVQARQP